MLVYFLRHAVLEIGVEFIGDGNKGREYHVACYAVEPEPPELDEIDYKHRGTPGISYMNYNSHPAALPL